MPSIDLYTATPSPPCRAVMLTAKAVGVDVNPISTNPMSGETRTPEFLKMNPAHTIPTMNDNGFYLGESRAILGYLANKYSKDDSLYPKDPARRAVVDSRLYFDMGLWTSAMNYFRPVAFGMRDTLDPAAKTSAEDNLGILETFLSTGGPYAAGDQLTIADHALVASVSSMAALKLWDMDKYPKVLKWMELCTQKMTGYEEANGGPAKMFGEFIGGKVKDNLKK